MKYFLKSYFLIDLFSCYKIDAFSLFFLSLVPRAVPREWSRGAQGLRAASRRRPRDRAVRLERAPLDVQVEVPGGAPWLLHVVEAEWDRERDEGAIEDMKMEL